MASKEQKNDVPGAVKWNKQGSAKNPVKDAQTKIASVPGKSGAADTKP